MINNVYRLNNKIFARKCTIKNITKKECDDFLNINHLQGEDKSSIRYGLFYNDELVAVMTFCKSRFDKKYEYELSRYCNKKYHRIVGGAGKLLSHFVKNIKPKNLVTYANRRYSEGKLYESLNFKKVGNTSPNYFYFKSGNVLYSRKMFQKHLLKIGDKRVENYVDPFDTDPGEDDDYDVKLPVKGVLTSELTINIKPLKMKLPAQTITQKPIYTRSVKVKKTIALLEKNNKEGLEITRRYVKTAFDCEEDGLMAMIKHVQAEEELSVNSKERYMLMMHLKELLK
jgi:hypothetical protein